MNRFLSLGALFGLLAVIIGAFAAHSLEDSLSKHALIRYHTGVEYQFYHVMALLVLGVISSQLPANLSNPPILITLSGIFFIVGILLFSGSLYLYALTGNVNFGIITPIGGLALIIGWVFLIAYALKNKSH
jgi:uncharacterized membrane protein YgdD (TMEM256/DUF423 family)